MAITAQQVKALRETTGSGMMDCQKALIEAEGDMEKAIDILRKKGQKISANRADREASEGAVFVHISDDGTEGIAFALNCETDFVGKNSDFQALGNTILGVAKAGKPATVEALSAMNVDGRTVADHITDFMGKIGEKIEVSQYTFLTGEAVAAYIHGDGSIGVLVNMSNANGTDVTEAGRDVGMQIASMRPIAVDADGIDAAMVEREKQVGLEKARAEGKPEQILEKIAEGFVQRFYKDNTLMSQAFVKDPKVTVKQYLDSVSKGLTVKEFSRVSIGR
jgi:elongation factor Ts